MLIDGLNDMKRKRAILFDQWKTLTYESQNPSPLTKFSEKLGYRLDDPKYWCIFEDIFMRKPLKNYEAPIKELLARLDIDYGEEDVEQLAEIMETINEQAEVYEDALDIVPKLKKKGFRLAIVTNSIYPPYKKFESKHETFLKNFDAIVKSYEVGVIKPKPKIFVEALNRLGIKPNEAMMIGDSVCCDVNGAEGVVIRGILIDRERKWYRRFYPKKVDDLYEFYEVVI